MPDQPEHEKMSQSNASSDSLSTAPATEPVALLANGSERGSESEEVEVLRGENAALRAKAEELEQMLAAAGQESEERWAERQREYEGLLEEKSEVIRGLHLKISELRARGASAPAAPTVIESDEPTPDRQHLLRLKRELQQEREQMERDEESMMAQMRQMEMVLAKDRAELARHRAEILRLQDELKRDLEAAARDGGLRERLTALQRPSGTHARPAVNQATPAPGQGPTTRSGLIRRIFGVGQ
jgi:hypothetical protein